MSYLTLCQDLRRECSASGTGPSATTGQTGEYLKIINWVKNAWLEIQQQHDDWRWMRKSFTVSATSGDGAYAYTDCTDTVSLAAISRFSMWHKDSFKCYLTSTGVGGEVPLRWMPWEQFRRIYRYGTQTNGPPAYVSEDPTQAFVLGPIPDATYTVSGDYQIGPQTLSADADTPEMPTRFHQLIVYNAMLRYGFHQVAPEAIQHAQLMGSLLHAALVRDQLPEMLFGGPLA